VDFGRIDPTVLAKAASRGKAVHAACAEYNNGALDVATLPEEIQPYVQQYIAWIQAVRFEPILTECMVLSEKYSYAGTFDATGASLRADPEFGGGNFISCRCVDSNDDNVCDGGCEHPPVGLDPTKVKPPATISPIVLPACS